MQYKEIFVNKIGHYVHCNIKHNCHLHQYITSTYFVSAIFFPQGLLLKTKRLKDLYIFLYLPELWLLMESHNAPNGSWLVCAGGRGCDIMFPMAGCMPNTMGCCIPIAGCIPIGCCIPMAGCIPIGLTPIMPGCCT